MCSRRLFATAGAMNATASFAGRQNTCVLVAPIEWLGAEKTV
jgi:hypothetical protein